MTIDDIAKAAGVSKATVSRVLNNSGYVKDSTREKINSIIKSYNYIPSAIARNLSLKDSNSIGLIVPDIVNPFFSDIISGVSLVFDESNLNLLLFNTNENAKKEHIVLETINEQRVKGILITPVFDTDAETLELLYGLEKVHIPVVLIDRNLENSDFDAVFVDNFNGSYEATKALINSGHKKIAIVSGPYNSLPGKLRFEGYLKALQDYKIPLESNYIYKGDFMFKGGYEGCNYLLNLENPPTAVFTSNNMMTIGFLKRLKEKNIELGKDFSLIGFDDIELFSLFDCNLSAVKRPTVEMGTIAAKLLLERIYNLNDLNYKKRHLVLPTSLVLRGSELID